MKPLPTPPAINSADNPDVQSIDSNFNVSRPPDVNYSPHSSAPDLQLKPKDNNGDCPLVIALIDTPVQPLGANLEKFLLPRIRVAGDCPVNPAVVTHGTAMADTMLSVLQKVTGGSTSVKILPVDVYGCGESTTTFDVGNGALEAAKKNVAGLSLAWAAMVTAPTSIIFLLKYPNQAFPFLRPLVTSPSPPPLIRLLIPKSWPLPPATVRVTSPATPTEAALLI